MNRIEGLGAFHAGDRSVSRGRGRYLAILALAGSVLAAPAGAGKNELDYGILAAIGQDSNPLRVSGDGPDGSFTDLRAGVGLRREIGSSVAFFADGGVRSRTYGSGTSGGDTTSGDLRIGFHIAPTKRLALSAGASYASADSTFLDRSDGTIYGVSSAPGITPATTVEIPDRFDNNATTTFLEARFRVNRKVRLQLDSFVTDTRYTDDYATETDLDRLDYSLWVVEPGVKLYLTGNTSLTLAAALSDLDYDALPALDDQGLEVPGTTRRYGNVSLRAALRITPSYGWHLRFGLRSSDRSDDFAGYYDRSALSAYAMVDRDVGLTGKLRIAASTRDVDYDKATVPGDPQESIRAGEVRRISGRYEHELGTRLSWFAEAGVQSTDNRDSLFAYDRNWFMTGIRFDR